MLKAEKISDRTTIGELRRKLNAEERSNCLDDLHRLTKVSVDGMPESDGEINEMTMCKLRLNQVESAASSFTERVGSANGTASA